MFNRLKRLWQISGKTASDIDEQQANKIKEEGKKLATIVVSNNPIEEILEKKHDTTNK